MARGISTQGDVLVSQTNDGVDLNTIWAEIADALELYNTERSAVARLLSYPTTVPADAVPQQAALSVGSQHVSCASGEHQPLTSAMCSEPPASSPRG